MAKSAITRNDRATPRLARASAAQVAAHAPEKLITYRVSVLAQVLSRLVDITVWQHLGLTSRQWRVLVILNRLGTSPSGEVARMSSFDHSQVSRVASELAGKGLITEASDPADRRKRILALTPAAIECLRNGLPISLKREERLRSRLSTADYATFICAMDALEDEAQQILREIREAE